MIRARVIAVFLLTVGANLPQEHQHANGEKLGEVHFATSCNEVAQKEFNRAVALLHSFQFSRAIEGFNAVPRDDATCGIAYWGVALSDWSNPFAAGMKDNGQLQLGRESAERGKTVGAKTERERAYLAAVSKLSDDYESTPQQARLIVYRDAMRDVAANYPEDHEAQIFYALAITASDDPADKTYAGRLKAGAILEKLFEQEPAHPGWRTTLSIRTTCQHWRSGRLWRRSVTRKLRQMRRMRCTCHRIPSPGRVTGRGPSTAT
jgi:hypothetical protein